MEVLFLFPEIDDARPTRIHRQSSSRLSETAAWLENSALRIGEAKSSRPLPAAFSHFPLSNPFVFGVDTSHLNLGKPLTANFPFQLWHRHFPSVLFFPSSAPHVSDGQ